MTFIMNQLLLSCDETMKQLLLAALKAPEKKISNWAAAKEINVTVVAVLTDFWWHFHIKKTINSSAEGFLDWQHVSALFPTGLA